MKLGNSAASIEKGGGLEKGTQVEIKPSSREQGNQGIRRYEGTPVYEKSPTRELGAIIRNEIEKLLPDQWGKIDDLNQMMIIKFVSEFEIEATKIQKELRLRNLDLESAVEAVRKKVEETFYKVEKLPENVNWQEKEQYVFSLIINNLQEVDIKTYEDIERKYIQKCNAASDAISEEEAKRELIVILSKVLPLIVTAILLLTFGYSENPDSVLADYLHEIKGPDGKSCTQIDPQKMSGDVYKNLKISTSLRSLFRSPAGKGISDNCKIQNLERLEHSIRKFSQTSLKERAIDRELSRIKEFKRRLQSRIKK